MDWELRRLLEHAGILRRNTSQGMLFEGDDEEGGDDPFASDDDEGDDPFGGDEDDAGGDDSGDEEGTREPPEALKPDDIEKYGSPRFIEVEDSVTEFFNQSITSASVGAQELESYPGEAIIPQDEDSTPAKEEEEETDEEANESFLSRRDKQLVLEARRLLREAEAEGAAADDFDMEHFATEVANYIRNIHNLADIEGGIFNMARQMILNNYGTETESEFIRMLAAKGKDLDFTGQYSDPEPVAPIAAGAFDGGGSV